MKEKKQNKIEKSISQRGAVFPSKWAFTLLCPIRNVFLSPKKLITYLELEENDNILEVGAGPGYFSTHIARFISKGNLVVSDIQQEMIDIARRRLNKKKIFNVQYHLCNGIDFPFKENSFDIIFMVTVLGEVQNKDRYLKEFYRMLKPNGILSITEQAGDADQLSQDEVKQLLKDSRMVIDKIYGSTKCYTINFRKM